MALTFDELLLIARRTGVANWVDPDTGKRGAVIAAPSSHRGNHGTMGSVVGLTRHHTGTDENYLPTQDYPTYQVVKEGRPGLVNSLSAFGLGRWSGIYVFSEFLSWHAGAWSYAGITDGNGHFLGIEAEGAGNRWTAFQREFYPRLAASILMFVGEGVDMMPRHADGAMPRGRKTDAANLWPEFVSQVQHYLDHPETLMYGSAAPTPDTEDDDDMRNPFWIYRNSSNGAVALGAPGHWIGLQNTSELKLARSVGWCRPDGYDAEVPSNVFSWMQARFLASEANDEQIKAALAELTADQPAEPTA